MATWHSTRDPNRSIPNVTACSDVLMELLRADADGFAIEAAGIALVVACALHGYVFPPEHAVHDPRDPLHLLAGARAGGRTESGGATRGDWIGRR